MSEKFILDPRFAAIMRKINLVMRPWNWCLIGGRAVEVWTNPPQTPDVDILAAVEDSDIRAMTKRFSDSGIELNDATEGLGSPILFFTDRRTKVEVDVIGAYETLHHEVIDRAGRKSISGVSFPVAWAEDIVILKSQAATDPGRPAGKRSRDRKAIFDIAGSSQLDRSYIQETLELHGWTEEIKFLRLLRILK